MPFTRSPVGQYFLNSYTAHLELSLETWYFNFAFIQILNTIFWQYYTYSRRAICAHHVLYMLERRRAFHEIRVNLSIYCFFLQSIYYLILRSTRAQSRQLLCVIWNNNFPNESNMVLPYRQNRKSQVYIICNFHRHWPKGLQENINIA